MMTDRFLCVVKGLIPLSEKVSYRKLQTGDIVNYEGVDYYLRPNGSVVYLYSTLDDYKRHKNKKCVAKIKLDGCVQKVLDVTPNASIEDILKTEEEEEEEEDPETAEDILSDPRRPDILSTEELSQIQKLFGGPKVSL